MTRREGNTLILIGVNLKLVKIICNYLSSEQSQCTNYEGGHPTKEVINTFPKIIAEVSIQFQRSLLKIKTQDVKSKSTFIKGCILNESLFCKAKQENLEITLSLLTQLVDTTCKGLF